MNKTLGSFLILFTFLVNCRPICRVEIPSMAAVKENWFGSEVTLQNERAWHRTENYNDKTVYFEKINTDVMNNCEKCIKIKNNFDDLYNNVQLSVFKENCRSLKISTDKNSADYIGYYKIISVKEFSKLAKFPGLLGPSSDTFKFWFKLENKKTNKVAFGYSSIGSSESSQAFSSSIKLMINALDDFKKDNSSKNY